MITLEDINTWLTLFDFDVPIELDLSESGEFELYDWNDSDLLSPKFNFDDSYFTIAEDTVNFNGDGTISLPDFNRMNPFYLFPRLEVSSSTEGKLFYFNPITNINLLLFSNDDLTNRKCYINYLGNVQRPINNHTPYMDENGWYVPLSIVFDDTISCDVAGAKTFTPKVDYVYAPPVINIVEDLFIGNSNSFKDKISLPVDYEVYYNNKLVTDLNVPSTDYKDKYLVRIVSKSEYPYIPSDRYVEIPASFKYLTDESDLNTYSYLVMNSNMTMSWDDHILVDGSCHVQGDGFMFGSAYFRVTGDLVFENVVFDCPCFIVEGSVSFKDCTFKNTDGTLDYKIVNNGSVSFNGCSFVDNGYLVNNSVLSVVSSTFNVSDKVLDLPLLHNTGSLVLSDNSFNFTGEFNSNSIMLVRGDDLSILDLLNSNQFCYDAVVTVDSIQYTVKGSGLVYGVLDDDTLHFNNLEVKEVE